MRAHDSLNVHQLTRAVGFGLALFLIWFGINAMTGDWGRAVLTAGWGGYGVAVGFWLRGAWR